MNYYTDVLKKYAVFSGRARRKEYWMFFLWNTIIIVILEIVLAMSLVEKSPVGMYLYWLYVLAVVIPNLAVFVRRLHDIGRSGWWILIGLIPLIGLIVLIVFGVTDSQPGDNKYGPNPKGVAAPTPAPATT